MRLFQLLGYVFIMMYVRVTVCVCVRVCACVCACLLPSDQLRAHLYLFTAAAPLSSKLGGNGRAYQMMVNASTGEKIGTSATLRRWKWVNSSCHTMQYSVEFAK